MNIYINNKIALSKSSAMLRPVLILAICFLSAQAEILLAPTDTEAATGTDVTLSCSLANQQDSACSVEWTHKKRNGDMSDVIYTSCFMIGEFGTRHSVVENFSKGQFNLKITNVSLEDSGTYTCLDNTDGSYRRAELIVFDSYPSAEFCSVIAPHDGPIGDNTCGIEPDEVTVSCKMSFSGNANPIMEWIQADGDILAPNITTTTYDSVTVSTLVLSAARVQSTAYTCRIKYLQPRLESKISWSAKPPIVRTMKRNETLLMSTSSQEFDCAKGGLLGNCTFSWTLDGNKLPDSGPVLTLTEERTGNYTCSAVCSIRGRSCSITQVIINDRQSSRMSKTVIMFATIAAVVVLLSLLSVGTLYVIRTRCRFLPKRCLSKSGEEICHECHDGIPKCIKPIADHDHDSLMPASANVA